MSKQVFTQRVVDFLAARAGVWIPAIEFEAIGGRQAWRTRISDARAHLPVTIENRCTRVRRPDGTVFVRSEYRYTPRTPVAAGRLC